MILFNQGPQDLRMDDKKIYIKAGCKADVPEGEAKKILKLFGNSDQVCIVEEKEDKSKKNEVQEPEPRSYADRKQQEQARGK